MTYKHGAEGFVQQNEENKWKATNIPNWQNATGCRFLLTHPFSKNHQPAHGLPMNRNKYTGLVLKDESQPYIHAIWTGKKSIGNRFPAKKRPVASKLVTGRKHSADRLQANAQPVGILKMIDPEIIKERWASERNQEQIVKCLTPPENRMKNSIQLKVFSDVQSRKSASGTGWQSLDYED